MRMTLENPTSMCYSRIKILEASDKSHYIVEIIVTEIKNGNETSYEKLAKNIIEAYKFRDKFQAEIESIFLGGKT